MFVINERQKGLPKGTQKRIVSLLHSINEPKIAVADRPAETTRAFVCTVEEAPKKFQIHVVLHLTRSQTKVMFSSDLELFPQEKLRTMEDEALDFVESMGFMMDNMNVPKLPPKDCQAMLKDLPIFEDPAQEFSASKMAEEIRQQESVEESPSSIVKSKRELDQPKIENESFSLKDLDAEFEREVEEGSGIEVSLKSVMNWNESSSPKGSPQDKGASISVVKEKQVANARLRALVRVLASF